jgi:hypothetical protein
MCPVQELNRFDGCQLADIVNVIGALVAKTGAVITLHFIPRNGAGCLDRDAVEHRESDGHGKLRKANVWIVVAIIPDVKWKSDCRKAWTMRRCHAPTLPLSISRPLAGPRYNAPRENNWT